MGSSRLPGKTMMKVGTKALISHVLDRLLVNFTQQDVILATTVNNEDDVLVDFVKEEFPKIGCFRGDQEDVRSRFQIIAQETNASHIIRITADDPFKDPRDIALCKKILLASNLDYCCNFLFNTIPLGMDVEGFSSLALHKAVKIDDSKEAREHVTTTFRNTEEFSGIYLREQRGDSSLRLTIDSREDLEFCEDIASLIQENVYHWQHTLEAANRVQQSTTKGL
jgi:spore coat polysaccharide biosynthesis protein SpsF (cytidylyltransferase family)